MALTTPDIEQAQATRHAIYWRDTEPVVPGPPLEGERHCDVCIVGGGYTGMWTAHFLKRAEPSIDVQIIEAEFAGAGASGHADGFVTPTIGHSLHTVIRGFGHDRAKEGYAAIGRSILELRRFCRTAKVDAEYEPNGFYLVATGDEQRRRLEQDVALARRLGMSYEVLERDDARSRIDSPAITAALRTPGGLVNPHKLARGLCRVTREQGVEIHERSRAVSLGRVGTRHVVTTPTGRVVARKLVLATNAYQHQFQPFRNDVMPVWSYAAVSEPLNDEQLAQVHWPDREGFVEARNFILFGRLTADNRLLVGGGPALYHYGRDMDEQRHLRNNSVTAVLREALGRYFPAWRDVRFNHAYGGCIAMTRDLVPHVGTLGNGVYYGYGYCGNGIAAAHTAGKALAGLVLERDDDYTNLLFVRGPRPRFPPEPLAFAGARAVSRLLNWQDRHPGTIRRQLI
jgi:glycine/D-amino acid oxidase-like deaminating enzyme